MENMSKPGHNWKIWLTDIVLLIAFVLMAIGIMALVGSAVDRDDAVSDYSLNDIPTEYLEGVEIRIQEERDKAFMEGCVYAIDNVQLYNDPISNGKIYLNLNNKEDTIDRFGVAIQDLP